MEAHILIQLQKLEEIINTIMRYFFKIYFIFIFALVSCQDKKNSQNLDITGHTFFRVEDTKEGKVLYQPCDAKTPKYIIYKDSIFRDWGQENYILIISKILNTKNQTIFRTKYKYNNETPETNDSLITFQQLDKNKKFWKINGEIFIDSLYINTIPHSKQPCKECYDDCEDIERSDSKNYNTNGTWGIKCNEGSYIKIKDKEIFFEVQSNQIYIDMVEVKRYDFEKGIAFKLKEKPEDMGRGGMMLNWKEYLNDKPIAYIKVIDDNTLYFYWYGFYNNKTKKREFTECQFQQEGKQNKDNSVILKKCEE
ncbi:hypothetical protein [Chryseobacterium echinoideorum]|uniref:hypothetical protein n=1 Tax=Chryseobacterium echinoideorum TaxID=1549648 RepID=UPI001184F13C|nr:hypothetical protein [Chryseobacterium echinoideorum]